MRLEQLGYEVSVVVDAALVDIQIKGGLTGIDIARRFRAERDIPVVFLTAYADPQTSAEATAAEPFGYLSRFFARRWRQR